AVALRPDSLAALVLLGYLHLLENNPDDVDTVVARVTRLNRESWLKSFFLGMAAAQRQKYQEAIGHLLHASELEPDELFLKVESAILYLTIGDVKSASSLLDQVLASHPAHSDATAIKAAAMVLGGRLVEAERLCRTVLERTPLHAQARVVLAIVLLRRGRLLD